MLFHIFEPVILIEVLRVLVCAIDILNMYR